MPIVYPIAITIHPQRRERQKTGSGTKLKVEAVAVMFDRTRFRFLTMLLTGFLACGIVASPLSAQTAMPAHPVAAAATRPGGSSAPVRYQPARFSRRAELHYGLVWGVDSLAVKYTESGEVIRFTYRVLDPKRAAELNNKKAEPSLIDPQAGVKLSVPALEKVGQLRQTGAQEPGTTYWMAFSNRGRLVKRGDHVIIVIGDFRADGLVVD